MKKLYFERRRYMIFTKRAKKADIERLVDEHLEVLLEEAETKEDISEILTLMERHRELRKNKRQISPDTLVVVAGNLLGIALILNYEKLNIVTSKALTFVLRGRA
jgi:rubrerythrin